VIRFTAILIGVALGLGLAELSLRIWASHSRGEKTPDLWTAELAPPPAVEGDCRSQERQAVLIDLVRPSEHQDLIYELRPEVRTCFQGTEVESNREGLRSDGAPVSEKSDEIYRILLLGDSHAFGWGVEWQDTLGEQLERLLTPTKEGRVVEVLNAGVPGYNTSQEAALLEHRGLDLEPDCILVLFLGNDLGLPTFLLEPEQPLDPRSSLLLALVHGLREQKRPFQVADRGLTDFVSASSRERVPGPYRHMVGFGGYRRALRRIAKLAERDGIQVVNAADYRSHGGVEKRREGLSKLMETLGIVEIDLEWPTGNELRISREDPHFNAAGQAEYARRLVRGLEEAGACGAASPGQ